MTINHIVILAIKVNTLEIDTIAHENPLMSTAEASSLVEDIKLNGQIEPIVIFDNKVMDGRNRKKAIGELKIDLKAIELTDCTYDEAVAYARSKNDHRRQMDLSQIAMRAAKDIMKTRVDEHGEKKSRTEWTKVEDHRDVKSGKIGKRSVESAISISKTEPRYAEQIFKGEKTLQQIKKIIELNKIKMKELSALIDTSLANTTEEELTEGKKSTELVYVDEIVSYLESDYSEEAARRYESYISGEATEQARRDLAEKLVKAEEEIKELKERIGEVD